MVIIVGPVYSMNHLSGVNKQQLINAVSQPVSDELTCPVFPYQCFCRLFKLHRVAQLKEQKLPGILCCVCSQV